MVEEAFCFLENDSHGTPGMFVRLRLMNGRRFHEHVWSPLSCLEFRASPSVARECHMTEPGTPLQVFLSKLVDRSPPVACLCQAQTPYSQENGSFWSCNSRAEPIKGFYDYPLFPFEEGTQPRAASGVQSSRWLQEFRSLGWPRFRLLGFRLLG